MASLYYVAAYIQHIRINRPNAIRTDVLFAADTLLWTLENDSAQIPRKQFFVFCFFLSRVAKRCKKNFADAMTKRAMRLDNFNQNSVLFINLFIYGCRSDGVFRFCLCAAGFLVASLAHTHTFKLWHSILLTTIKSHFASQSIRANYTEIRNWRICLH